MITYPTQKFRTIENVIKQKSKSLINEDDKNKFRKACLDLANYLITHNNPPLYYEHYRVSWKGTINNRLKVYYKKLDKHGGCPLILEEKDKKILELKYEEVDFCDKKKKDLEEIKQLSRKLKGSDIYISKCNAYNEWIEQKKNYFKERSSLFGTCYQKTDQKKKKRPSEFICDLTNPKTFEQISDCQVPYKLSTREAAPDNSEEVSQTKGQETHEDPIKSQESQKRDKQAQPTERTGTKVIDQNSDNNQHVQKIQQGVEPPFQQELQTQEEVSSFESSPKENESNPEDSLRSETRTILAHPDLSVDVTDKSASFSPVPLATKSENSFDITLFSPTLSTSLSNTLSSTVPSEISVPSSHTRRSEHLAQGYLEHPKYGDEEIIKKIKIHECNMIKKVNTLNQKNERTKTIIEVHLEVLEAYRKEEWECKKGEFLEICLDVLTKERYGTHSNLTNDDLIMKNVKSCGHIEKQKILWNKWIERHKNISDKFKKVDWFNNLKNDWKKEKSYIKEMEELKNKSSNEYQSILFLEREKDVWRRWISEKGKILKQIIDQNWFKELSELN
ncbi:STP1 protein, partial [Plasmodium malariae]